MFNEEPETADGGQCEGCGRGCAIEALFSYDGQSGVEWLCHDCCNEREPERVDDADEYYDDRNDNYDADPWIEVA